MVEDKPHVVARGGMVLEALSIPTRGSPQIRITILGLPRVLAYTFAMAFAGLFKPRSPVADRATSLESSAFALRVCP